MKISLEIRRIFMPFRFSYGHAKASHRGVESVICIARDENGTYGLGEAVPRHYVTGESCASVMADVKKLTPILLQAATSIESLQATLQDQANRWKGPFPSCAFCVIELALVDLLTRRVNSPFLSALGKQQTQMLTYSGSIGMGRKAFLHAQLIAYRAMGLKSFKLKVGGNHDMEALRTVRKIMGNDVRLFVDTNGVWDRETAMKRIEELHSLGVWAIEEPLKRRSPEQNGLQCNCEGTLDQTHYKDNAWLRERSPIDIIADESVISQRSLRAAIEHGAFDIVDIRLSKLGGSLLSASMVQQAVSAGMRFYIGAMVGESAILASAGSQFGSVYADHLLIQGYSHGALHCKKIAKGGPRLQRGASLMVGQKPGLGISLEQRVLDQVTQEVEIL